MGPGRLRGVQASGRMSARRAPFTKIEPTGDGTALAARALMAFRRRGCTTALALALVASVRAASAQLPPLVEVSTQYLPESLVPGENGLGASVVSYDAALNVPVALSETTYLIPGAQYHVDSVSYSGASPGFTALTALHAVDFPLLLVHRIAESWALAIRAWPGAAADFHGMGSGALRLGGLAMASWLPNRQFTLGAGILASHAFGELLPLPLFYVDWQPSSWLRVEASLPAFVSAHIALGGRLELGVLADVSGNEYAIGHPGIRERYPCASNGVDDPVTPTDESLARSEYCLDHLAYSVFVAGGLARVRLVSSLWLTTFFGHTLSRRYDLKNAAGGTVPGGEVDLPNELVLRMGLLFRIPGTH